MKTQIAKIISVISLPYLMALGTIYLLLLNTESTSTSFYWTVITLCFVVGIPSLFVSFQMVRGKITNQNVDIRKQRKPVYLVGLLSLILGVVVLHYLNAPSKLSISMYVVCLVGLIAFITNTFFHKTSAHMIGMGLAFSLLFYDYPKISICLLLFFIPVSWARFHLKKHTLPEIITGSLISSLCGLIMGYYFF